MVPSPLVAANPITLPQCPLCTAQPERVKWYLVGVAPRQASVGCICGYFSWVSLWVFQLDVFVGFSVGCICEERTQREQLFCLNLAGSGRCGPAGVPFHSENFKCLIRLLGVP